MAEIQPLSAQQYGPLHTKPTSLAKCERPSKRTTQKTGSTLQPLSADVHCTSPLRSSLQPFLQTLLRIGTIVNRHIQGGMFPRSLPIVESDARKYTIDSIVAGRKKIPRQHEKKLVIPGVNSATFRVSRILIALAKKGTVPFIQQATPAR